MKRTMIITIVTTGENAYRAMEAIEMDLLDYCADANTNRFSGSTLSAEICVVPLSDEMISKLCNTTTETVWKESDNA